MLEIDAKADETVEATGEDYGSYNWNCAMTVAETTTNYKMAEKFAELLEQKSGGTVTLTLYPGGQLGNTTEQTEATVGGSVDFYTGMTTDLTDFVPEMGLFDMPNLFDDVDHMRSFILILRDLISSLKLKRTVSFTLILANCIF